MFVGTVVSVTGVVADMGPEGRQNLIPDRYSVRLTVEEDFTDLAGKEIEVSTVGSTAACGYEFTRGVRYLVYAARPSRGSPFDVSRCSRTKELAYARDDLELLRAAVAGNIETRIFGNVRLSNRGDEAAGDQAGLTVRAANHDREYTAVTDERGQFRFRHLPAGTYRLRAWLNGAFSKEALLEPTISETQPCAEVDFAFLPGARVAGTVADSSGRATSGIDIVLKDLTPFEEREQGPDVFWAISDLRGRFEIQGVASGRYAIGLGVGRTFDKDAPYMSVEATVGGVPTPLLTLSPSQSVEGVQIRFPDQIELTTIDVMVLRPDGSPASGAVLDVQDLRGWVLRRVDTKDGRAQLKLFVGEVYRIHAYDVQGARQGDRSEPVTLRVQENNPPLMLTIARPPGRR